MCIERLRDLTTYGFWCRSHRSRSRVDRLRLRVADRLQARFHADGRALYRRRGFRPEPLRLVSIAALISDYRTR